MPRDARSTNEGTKAGEVRMVREAPARFSTGGLLENQKLLTPLESLQVRFIRRTLDRAVFDKAVRAIQRRFGATWILAFTANLRHVKGLERLPAFAQAESYILVSNHRSFFDLYVVASLLVRRGLGHRILFPVRSEFFYESPLGFLVNGFISIFAMYPPVFRDKKRAALNLAAIEEMNMLMARGGIFLGLHPEGTRKKDGDPYTLLPAQSGVGRVIQTTRATVIPVFVNGLVNDVKQQVAGNFDGTGDKVTVVFGEPIVFGALLDQPSGPRTHKQISERCLEVIAKLGEEEKAFRSSLG